MTPILKLRSFTTDQYLVDKVLYSNFYRLKGFPEGEKKPIILDLGAHCGYFSFLALSLGAKKSYAFEPFTPNYKMLLSNLGENQIGQVIPYQLGVYVAPTHLTFRYPALINKSFFDFGSVGIDGNVESSEFCKCCVLPLDTILEHYVGESVDIMKLSIGYSEMAVISTSNLVGEKVSHICGEIALDKSGQEKFLAILNQKGFLDNKFYPVEGEESKFLFHASKGNNKEVFLEK